MTGRGRKGTTKPWNMMKGRLIGRGRDALECRQQHAPVALEGDQEPIDCTRVRQSDQRRDCMSRLRLQRENRRGHDPEAPAAAHRKLLEIKAVILLPDRKSTRLNSSH